MNTRRKIPSATAAVSLPETALPAEVQVPKEAMAMQAVIPAAPRQPEPKLYPAKIAAALIKITREIGKITKQGRNTFHNYDYAKWEDILEKLSPLIAEAGLIIVQNEVSHGAFENVTMIEITYEFSIINEDGDVWPDRPRITAICKIRDTKGIIDDKAASKCHTQAQKYMMTSLFKIRTGDMADHDADAEQPSRNSQRHRSVPSADGRTRPHAIAIINGEGAAAWVDRFIAAIAKATSEAEIDAWDKANDSTIAKVQRADTEQYNRLVDALEKHHARVKPAPAPKTITTEKAAPAAEQAEVNDDERDWLMGLSGAFSGCEDIATLDAEHDRLMEPQRGKVGQAAWQMAIDAYDEHRERIERA